MIYGKQNQLKVQYMAEKNQKKITEFEKEMIDTAKSAFFGDG